MTSDGLQAHLSQETLRIKQILADRKAPAPRKAVVIVDGSVALLPPADARQIQASWLKQNVDLLRLVTHQMGFVLPNPMLRGFVAAVFYIAPLPVPSSTHASLDDAIAWAIKEVHSINGTVDEALLNEGSVAVERARSAAMLEVGRILPQPVRRR